MDKSCLSEFEQSDQGGVVDTITCVVEQGPIWVGDLPSKHARNVLVQSGHIVPILVKAEDGYYAATHKGRDLYKALYGTSLGGGADTVAEAMAHRLSDRALHRAKGV